MEAESEIAARLLDSFHQRALNWTPLGAKVDIFDEVDEALRLQNEQVYTLGSRQAQHDPKRTVIETLASLY